MSNMVKGLLLLAGAVLVLLGTNRYSHRYQHRDPFGVWLKGNGTLLRDYDAEQKQIDEYMK